MKRTLLLLLVLVMTLSLVVGCASNTEKESVAATDETTKESAEATEETAEAGSKILVIGSDVDVPSLDHSLATDGLSFEVIGSCIEGLAQYDASGALIPAMAESWDISEDGKVYTFHLRDAEWENGTPVTANDFVFAWQRICDPDLAAEYSFIMQVADVVNAGAIISGEMDKSELGVAAIDDKTFEVTLENGAPFFIQLMTFNSFFPINEAFYNEVGADQYALSPETFLANGAFTPTEWTSGYGLTLAKNASYYAADEVSIDGIEWRTMKDPQTAALEFESGNIDISKLSAELVDKYKGNEAFTIEPAGYVWYVAPNQGEGGNEAFQNANFRKALALSYDKEFIVDDIFNDGSVAANYIIPVGLAKDESGTDFREASGSFLEYDLDAASVAWEMALEELGTDSVEIELLFDDSEQVKTMAEFMQSEWQTNLPGLTVSLKTQPKKQRLALMDEYDYEVALTRWGPDYADPQTYLDLFASTVDMANIQYGGEAYQALYDKIIAGGEYATSDKTQERWDAMLEMEKVLLDDAAIFPIYQSGYSFLIDPAVDGIEVHAVGIPHVYKHVTISE